MRCRHLIMTVALVGALGAGAVRAAELPASLDLQTIRGIGVQHNGRWMPLDTLARDLVETITGEVHFQGRDPVLWLLAWTYDPESWRAGPLITIGNTELRGELELPADREVFSYNELIRHGPLRAQMDALSAMGGGQPMDPLQKKVSGISERLTALHNVFANHVIRVIPSPNEAYGAWRTIPAAGAESGPAVEPVQVAWRNARAAFLANDAAAFDEASADLARALEDLPAAYRPAAKRLATELHYNQLNPYRKAWMIMVAGAVFAALAALVRRPWFTVVSVGVMLAGFSMLSYGLWLRWTIAGRIPAANMFESLLFLSWGMGAFAILSMALRRDRVVPITASAMGALALFLAETLPLDGHIRPIAPVLLDTIWMSIHVPVIMVSYSVLALAALIAHAQMITMAAAPHRRQLIETIDGLHQWYVHVGCILLGAGIVTGSMWADSSWGRYWGWDPKEVWSLIAFLAYLAILHFRVEREAPPQWVRLLAVFLGVMLLVILARLLSPLNPVKVFGLVAAVAVVLVFVLPRGPFATACKSTIAFWTLVMTYLGVNYVLSIGLHSYGFGTGAVVRYMYLTGGVDLLLIGVCTLVYLVRRGESSPEADSPMPVSAGTAAG